MTLKEQLIGIYESQIYKECQNCLLPSEKASNYDCEICNEFMCSIWCWFNHLFWHWRQTESRLRDVTGWFKIRRPI